MREYYFVKSTPPSMMNNSISSQICCLEIKAEKSGTT